MADIGDIRWKKLTVVGSDVEATMILDTLTAEGIPALKQSSTAGVFGYGFSAETPEGFTLLVPSDRFDEAMAALESRPGL
ncbi:MAG: DUF2007 domain-containing protein [Ignavibacteria bacterium]|nr:DUF2007 domain-containing protein [Ignavibacteria bacterium]